MDEKTKKKIVMGAAAAATLYMGYRLTRSNADKVGMMYHQVRSLSPLQQRKIAAIVGGCVADAATRPLHWIYDQSKFDSIVQKNNPEFWPENKSPFYSRPLGAHSCYGDGTIVLLRSMVRIGDFSMKDYCHSLFEFYGPGTPYDVALQERNHRLGKYDPKTKREWTEPIQGPWMNSAKIKFISNYQKGSMPFGNTENSESDGFCAVLPLIAQYANEPKKLESILEPALEVLSAVKTSTERSIFASKIICNSITKGCKRDILTLVLKTKKPDFPVSQFIKDEIQEVITDKNTPHTQAVKQFGKHCGNPGNFKSALHAIVTSDNYVEAVRKVILAGGCNCSRSIFVGATMGALGGIDCIPSEWVSNTIDGKEVLQLAISLVTHK